MGWREWEVSQNSFCSSKSQTAKRYLYWLDWLFIECQRRRRTGKFKKSQDLVFDIIRWSKDKYQWKSFNHWGYKSSWSTWWCCKTSFCEEIVYTFTRWLREILTDKNLNKGQSFSVIGKWYPHISVSNRRFFRCWSF